MITWHGDLSARPDAAILIVPTTQAAEAVRAMVGSPYIVASCTGRIDQDWSPIHHRKVLCCPNNGDGAPSMAELAQHLAAHCPEVKLIDVAGMPDGWDIADSGFDWPAFKAWAVPRIRVVYLTHPEPPPPSPVPEPPPVELPPIEAYSELDPTPYHKPLHAEVWPTPLDIFRTPLLPELCREWLPSVIADFATDQTPVVGTDFAIMAMSCLAACAGACHDMIKLQPHEHNSSWLESTRLWIAIVGKPSVRKTPAFKRATSQLKKIDIELGKHELATLAKFSLDRKIYEAAEKKYVAAQAKGGATGEPVPPEEPTIDRILIGDTTVAALSEILKRTNRGVLRIADELSGWFSSMDAFNSGNGGKDRADWLESYNGGSQRIDRILRGTIIVPNWSVSVLGGIQPESIQRIVGRADDDGLIQRFMPVVSYSTTAGGQNRPIDRIADQRYRDTIDRLFSYQPTGVPLSLSPEALEIHASIVKWQHDIVKLGVLPSAMETCLGKYEGLAARLMLTFHLIECASSHERYDRPISEATAERVFYFMTEFLFFHTYEFYTETLCESGLTDHVRRIGSLILAKNYTTLTNRELTHEYRWWRTAKDWEKIQVIGRLTDAGWIRRKPGPAEHFKTIPTAFLINSDIHAKFSQLATEEQARRAKIIEIMNRGREEHEASPPPPSAVSSSAQS